LVQAVGSEWNRWFKRQIGTRQKSNFASGGFSRYQKKVQENAQRLKIARQKLKEELRREFSTKTLKHFLKNLIADTKDGVSI
jgi:hypothetical protein